jgi:hypothetical protein
MEKEGRILILRSASASSLHLKTVDVGKGVSKFNLFQILDEGKL